MAEIWAEERAVAAGETWRIDSFRTTEPLAKAVVFTFTNWALPGTTSLHGPGFGGDFLLRSGFDVVAFKSNRNHWFHDLPAAVVELAAAAGRSGLRRLAYGSSMGGYGAVRWSRKLGCELVLAVSPQYSIAEDYDRRWSADAQRLAFVTAINPDNTSPACHYVLVADGALAPDAEHVRRIAAALDPAAKASCVNLPCSGHPTLGSLAEAGVLKPFVLGILEEGVIRTPPRGWRRQSPSALYRLAERAMLRRRFRLALSVINLALAQGRGDLALYLWLRARMLLELGQEVEAEASIRAAIQLQPARGGNWATLAQIRLRQGDCVGAWSHLALAHSLEPDNPHIRQQRDNVHGRLLADQDAARRYVSTLTSTSE